MTVCVGIAVNDCLVFAADSASSLVSTDPETHVTTILNVYQHGDKVFNLRRGLPICAMTCGMGNIGIASISTLAKDLRSRFNSTDAEWKIDPANYTIEEVARKAKRFLFDERFQALDPKPGGDASFEFWIGGYSSNHAAGHQVWKIEISGGACGDPITVISAGGYGFFVGGQPGPVNRLIIGFDDALVSALPGMGVLPENLPAVITELRARTEVQLVSQTMPVRDAIDLADFLVDTTKRFFRFLPGADIVGGDTDIAVVTRYEGFKWIKRKHFYSPSLNPLEPGHV
jgi:hypothetical protein